MKIFTAAEDKEKMLTKPTRYYTPRINCALAAIVTFLVTTITMCFPVHADKVIVVNAPKISSCLSTFSKPCSDNVYYVASGTTVQDIHSTTRPDPSKSLQITTWGVHCQEGGTTSSPSFTGCYWLSGINSANHTHEPGVVDQNRCVLKNYESWEMLDYSGCDLAVNKWGTHRGASPGAECVMYGQKDVSQSSNTISTPFGILSAELVANSKDTYCVKPLPPDVVCQVQLPGVIDHGTVQPNVFDRASINGTVDCGSSPVVTVVGENIVQLGADVESTVSASVTNGQYLTVISELMVQPSANGVYSGSVVISVSPN